jgi:uncharacterized protein YraI
VLDDGAELFLTGESSGGYLGVTFDGTSGWAFASYLAPIDGEPTATAKTATVIDGALNLRTAASDSSDVLTVIPDGATVTLLGPTENGFSAISFDGAEGWAASPYLSTHETGAVSPASGNGGNGPPASGESTAVTPAGETGTEMTATVTGGNLNLRAGDSTSASVLTVIPDGATVTLLGETSNGFAKIWFDGAEGWVWADCLV